ncbi:unnamed protein product [Bemisia tabaci]|uniref:G-protein coupled receptors family 1 profile domain-containing protein n=1 Tax=Bemisia tabaci TaxID=7038 RepID=A0A9P0EY47_BEMTA|nr:unnamed protein product [Bemisia tabaci]
MDNVLGTTGLGTGIGSASRHILKTWVLGWYMCKVVPYVQGVSVAASVYSLIAVSIDR